MYKLLDGKIISNKILEELKNKVEKLKLKGKTITICDIVVGNDEASKVYVNNKKKKCEDIGINYIVKNFDENIDEPELLQFIKDKNNDKDKNTDK